MAWLNYTHAVIGGRLVDTPKAGVDTDGNTTCKIRVAVNHGTNRSLFHAQAKGPVAERIVSRFCKGSNILLDCMIATRSIPTADGREIAAAQFLVMRAAQVDSRDEYEELLADEEAEEGDV